MKFPPRPSVPTLRPNLATPLLPDEYGTQSYSAYMSSPDRGDYTREAVGAEACALCRQPVIMLSQIVIVDSQTTAIKS